MLCFIRVCHPQWLNIQICEPIGTILIQTTIVVVFIFVITSKIWCLPLSMFLRFLDSNIVANFILQDLLAYVSSKHSYLKYLPQRLHQKMNTIEFVELEKLQPDTLVHAVLRVVDITILTGKYFECLFNFSL